MDTGVRLASGLNYRRERGEEGKKKGKSSEESSGLGIARIEETKLTGGKETSILGTEIFKHRVCTRYEEEEEGKSKLDSEENLDRIFLLSN